MVIGDRRITDKELNDMLILKRDVNTKLPKVLLKNGTIYKIEPTHVASRMKSYFEILSEIEELDDCIFPKEILYINSKEIGYTTRCFSEYKNIDTKLKKNKFSLEWKKAVIYKIIDIIKKLHFNGVVHNDLHCSNILNASSNIKIIDFDQLKISGVESNYMYMAWLKREINYLNLLIISILYEKNLSYISLEEQKLLVEGLNISMEFKEYLNNCADLKEEQIGMDLEQYVKSVTRKDILDGKNLVNSLKL